MAYGEGKWSWRRNWRELLVGAAPLVTFLVVAIAAQASRDVSAEIAAIAPKASVQASAGQESVTQAAAGEAADQLAIAGEAPTAKPKPSAKPVCRQECSPETAAKSHLGPTRSLGDTTFDFSQMNGPARAASQAQTACAGPAAEVSFKVDECAGNTCFIKVSGRCQQAIKSQGSKCRKVCE